MNLNSKYFDSIRASRKNDKRVQVSKKVACDWPECKEEAGYPAPTGARESDGEAKHRNFCFAHVKQYNRSFNYFEGMTEEDSESFRRAARTGHRPTWSMGTRRARGTKAEDWQFHDPLELMSHEGNGAKEKKRASKVTSGQERALSVLELPTSAKPEDVRKRYKALVKQYHPDANGGERTHEEQLQSVIQAHDYLKASGFC
jgi:DnaJ-domain-containing protein 1